jgi:hypothetical protein
MRDIFEFSCQIILLFMLVIGLFMLVIGLFMGIGLVASYNQAQYIKNHYNIDISTKDLFWNEKLVMSELRSKGIITDTNQNNNIKISQEK